MFSLLKYSVSILLSLGISSVSLADKPYEPILQEAAANQISFGLSIGGANSFSYNETKVFPMASVTKIFVASSVLQHLGPGYRFETEFHWKQKPESNIAYEFKIVGSGDPTWGMKEFGWDETSKFDDITKKLVNAGIKKIVGPIKVQANDARWFDKSVPEGWDSEDPYTVGGARAYGVNNNINCAAINISSLSAAQWVMKEIDFPIKVQLSQGSSKDVKVVEKNGQYVLSGTVVAGSLPLVIYFPAPRVESWIKKLLESAFLRNGIEILSPIATPAGSQSKKITDFSPPMQEMIVPFLKKSVNFMGDAFLKELARKNGSGQGSFYKEGSLILQKDAENLAQFFDGSGLSYKNVSTAISVMTYLEGLKESPYFESIWKALPIAGVDGTLANRMIGSAAQGVLRAKTGTLSGYSHLAGFVPIGNDFIPFVSFSQGLPASLAKMKKYSDQLAIAIVENNQ